MQSGLMIALLQARMPHRMPRPRTPQSNKRAAMKRSLRRLDEKVASTYALRETIVASRFSARLRCHSTREYIVGQKPTYAAWRIAPKKHNTKIATTTATIVSSACSAGHLVFMKCHGSTMMRMFTPTTITKPRSAFLPTVERARISGCFMQPIVYWLTTAHQISS